MYKVITACALGILLFAGAASAASVCSIEVSPLTLELQVDPGRAHTDAIQITNTGANRQHIKAYCQDWTLRPDGVVIFVSAGRLPQSASGWVALTPSEFDLAPGDSQQVRYTVRVPSDAVGETRTVVIFEAEAQALSLRGAPSRVIPRIGTIIYVQSGAAAPAQARVAEFNVGPEMGLLVIENAGPGHLRFTGRLEIRRSGELVRASDLNAFVVLPAPFNRHQVKLSKEAFAGLADGEYEVTAVLDCGGPSLLGARTKLAMGPTGGK
jgi:P pilus assembly chaperone PapD